jgi:hypothetical protein
VCAKPAACASSKRLEHLEATKVVYAFKLSLKQVLGFGIFFFATVAVAKCPVVATATLFEVCLNRIIIPDESLSLLFGK